MVYDSTQNQTILHLSTWLNGACMQNMVHNLCFLRDTVWQSNIESNFKVIPGQQRNSEFSVRAILNRGYNIQLDLSSYQCLSWHVLSMAANVIGLQENNAMHRQNQYRQDGIKRNVTGSLIAYKETYNN